jgi:hypothetical protein
MSLSLAPLASATDQRYLFEARQMQALSLAVHIPLVCFGIAFPALVLFAEWRYLRTGDPLYRTLARRWSKIMLALFAVGVVTGTILSFELGLLWPVWMQDFGNVFGLGFTLEGFSFFVEAIFIGIYVYGWDKITPRWHFASGLPIAVAGVTGSMFVISVNAWMNHPTGFALAGGRAVDAHPWSALFANPFFWSEYVHMYFAGYIVCGFLMAGAYAGGGAGTSGRRWASRCPRRPSPRRCRSWSATGRPGTWRSPSRSSWPRWKGSRRPPGAPPSTCSAGTTGIPWCTASRSRGCSPCWPSITRTPRSRA